MKVALLNFDEEDETLTVVKSLNSRIDPIRPEHLAYEHDPREVLKATKSLIKAACRGVSVDSIVLTSYLFGVFLADKNLEPITNIYTWVDERASEVLDELKPHSKELYVRTGCPCLHVYGLPKLLWLMRRAPYLVREAKHFMDSKSFLMNFFTGRNLTDLSSASGTYQMLNIRSLKWDPFALSISGIDESRLPEVGECFTSEPVRVEVAHELGISEKVPVVLGVYDGASMIYGLTGGVTGLGVINIGSSAMMRAVISEPIIDSCTHMRFQTYYLTEGTWLAGGAISNGGVVVEHIIKLLYGVEVCDAKAYAEIFNSLDKLSKRPQNLLTVPILLAERLPMNPSRRVSVLGLDSTTRREDIVLSTVEGVIMLLSLLYKAMEENGVTVNEIRIGGKLTEHMFVRKLITNILGKTVLYSGLGDVSHLGNLFISLKAMKFMSSEDIRELCSRILQSAERITPTESEVIKYSGLLREFEELISKLYS